MKKTLFIFIILLSFSSCKTIKKSVSSHSFNPNIKSKKLEKLVNSNRFEYEYFSSKIRVIFNNQNFTANLRMKKDSIIWISLTGPFNIEGARVIITKDYFEMVNKLEKTYYKKPLTYLRNYVSFDVSFNELENLLVGNSLQKRILKQKIETKDHKYIVKGNVRNLEILYFLLANGRLNKMKIVNKKENQKVEILYSKYEKVNNYDFSLRRNFIIKSQNEENLIDLKYYKMKFDKTSFPFKVPTSYIRK